ncbi:MAG: hypothetical protein KIT17_10095, partial [Rubrivivax sp.]|nr:hypothetical protein [Rubrivivax sp.]
RLVTVTGPGGIGKTRLAQAWCEGPGAGERIVWVDLSGIDDAAQLPALLLTRLGAAGRPGAPGAAKTMQPGAAPAPSDQLAAMLAPLVLTLVLDNAEPIAADVAALVQPLLEAAPRLRLLVTSQVPLRLHAEQVYRLGTLPVPPPRATPAEAMAHAAVALFVERARAADPLFELAAGNVTSVVEICRRLDGLPLALELAAARVATIGVNALAAALGAALDAAVDAARSDPGLGVLGEGPRDAPQRQRTLHAALAWSHQLLDAPARRVFRRLGVFSGGFTLAAAQAVAGDDDAAGDAGAAAGAGADGSAPTQAAPGRGTLDAWGVMNTLGRLVEHSLVAKDGAEPPRFGLLESARRFALEQLERAGETAATRARHLAWCRTLVHDVLGDGRAPPGAAAAATLALEYANLRAALEHALAPGSARRLSQLRRWPSFLLPYGAASTTTASACAGAPARAARARRRPPPARRLPRRQTRRPTRL